MLKHFIFLLILLNPVIMNAQTDRSAVAGTYYLKNIRETAAGFHIREDGTFEFFFSYGALDRQAKGLWKLVGDSVVFQSTADPQKDFIPGDCQTVPGEKIIVRLAGTNSGINPFFKITLIGKNGKKEKTGNSGAEFIFDKMELQRIQIQFEWCPEKTYEYVVSNKQCNFFSFTVQPSVLDVYFNQTKLKWNSLQLSGMLPFSGSQMLIFEKGS